MTFYEPWWPPSKIIYSKEQVIWLLHNLSVIREGYWPLEYTSYTDPKIRMKPSKKAPYETPIQIFAELTDRLENAGLDGLMLECYYSYGKTYCSLARHFNISEERVEKRIERALNYVTGFNRKGRYWQRW